MQQTQNSHPIEIRLSHNQQQQESSISAQQRPELLTNVKARQNNIWGVTGMPQSDAVAMRVLNSGRRKRRQSEWIAQQTNVNVFKLDPVAGATRATGFTAASKPKTRSKFPPLESGMNFNVRFRSLNLREELCTSQQNTQEDKSKSDKFMDREDLFKFQPSITTMAPELLMNQKPSSEQQPTKRETGIQAVMPLTTFDSTEPASVVTSKIITARMVDHDGLLNQIANKKNMRRGSLAISHFATLQTEIEQKRRTIYLRRKELQTLGKDSGRDSPLPNENSHQTYGFTSKRVEQIFKRLQRDMEVADPRSLDRKRKLMARSVELTTLHGIMKRLPGIGELKENNNASLTMKSKDPTTDDHTINVMCDEDLVRVEEENTEEPQIARMQLDYDTLERKRAAAGKSELFSRSPKEAFLQAMVGNQGRYRLNQTINETKMKDARKLKRPQHFRRLAHQHVTTTVKHNILTKPVVIPSPFGGTDVDPATTKTTRSGQDSSVVPAPARASVDAAQSSIETRAFFDTLPIDLGDESRLNTVAKVEHSTNKSPFATNKSILVRHSARQASAGSSPQQQTARNSHKTGTRQLDILQLLKHESSKAARAVAKKKKGGKLPSTAVRESLTGLPTTERKQRQDQHNDSAHFQAKDRSITPSEMQDQMAPQQKREKFLVHFDAMPQPSNSLNDREASQVATPQTQNPTPITGRPITQKIQSRQNADQKRGPSRQTGGTGVDGIQGESRHGDTLRFPRGPPTQKPTQMRFGSETAGDRSRLLHARDSSDSPQPQHLSGEQEKGSTPTKLMLGETLVPDQMPFIEGLSPKTEELINTARTETQNREKADAAELAQLHHSVILAQGLAARDSRNVVIVNRGSAKNMTVEANEDTLDKTVNHLATNGDIISNDNQDGTLHLNLRLLDEQVRVQETSLRGGGSSDSGPHHMAPLSHIYDKDGHKQAVVTSMQGNSAHKGTGAQGYEMNQIRRRRVTNSSQKHDSVEKPAAVLTREQFERINCQLENPLQIQKIMLNEPPISVGCSPRRHSKRKSEDRARHSRQVDSRKKSPRSKISVNMGHGRFKRETFAKNLDIMGTQVTSTDQPVSGRDALQMVLTDGFSTVPATALPATGAGPATHDSTSLDRAGRNHHIEPNNGGTEKGPDEVHSPVSDEKAACMSRTTRVGADRSSRKAMQSFIDFQLAGSRLKDSRDAACHSDDDEIVKNDSEIYSQPQLDLQLRTCDERMAAAYGRPPGSKNNRPAALEIPSPNQTCEAPRAADFRGEKFPPYRAPAHPSKANGCSHQVVASLKEQGLASSGGAKQGLEVVMNVSHFNSFGSARRKIVNFRPKHNQNIVQRDTSRLRHYAATGSLDDPLLQALGGAPDEHNSEIEYARTRNSMGPGAGGLANGESVLLHAGWRTSEQSSPSLVDKRVEIKQILSLRPGRTNNEQQRKDATQDLQAASYMAAGLQHGADCRQAVHIYNSRAIVRMDAPTCGLDLIEPSFSPVTQRELSQSVDMKGESVNIMDPRLTVLALDDKPVVVEAEEHDPAAWPKFWSSADSTKRDNVVESLLKGHSRAEARHAALKQQTGRSSVVTPRLSKPTSPSQSFHKQILDAAIQHWKESINERQQTQVTGKQMNIENKTWEGPGVHAKQSLAQQQVRGPMTPQQDNTGTIGTSHGVKPQTKEIEQPGSPESPGRQHIKKSIIMDAVHDATSLGEPSGAHLSQDDFFPMPVSAPGNTGARNRRPHASLYSGDAARHVNFVGGGIAGPNRAVQEAGHAPYDKARISPCKVIVKTNMTTLNQLPPSPHANDMKGGRGRVRRASKLARVHIERAAPGEATSFSGDSKEGTPLLQQRQDMPSMSPEPDGNLSQSYNDSAAGLMLRTAEARVTDETQLQSKHADHLTKATKSPMTAGGAATSKMHRGTGNERAGTVHNPDLPNRSLMGHYYPPMRRHHINQLSHIGDKGSVRAGTTHPLGYDSRAPDWPRDDMSDIMGGRPPSPGSLLCSTDEEGQALMKSFRRGVKLRRGPRPFNRYVTFVADDANHQIRAGSASLTGALDARCLDREMVQAILLKDHDFRLGKFAGGKKARKVQNSVDLTELMRQLRHGLHPLSSHRDSAARTIESHGKPIVVQKVNNAVIANGTRGTTMPASRTKNRFLSNEQRRKLNETYRRTNFSCANNKIAEALASVPNEALAAASLEAMPNFGLFSKTRDVRASETLCSEGRTSYVERRRDVGTKPRTQSDSPASSVCNKTMDKQQDGFLRHPGLLTRRENPPMRKIQPDL